MSYNHCHGSKACRSRDSISMHDKSTDGHNCRVLVHPGDSTKTSSGVMRLDGHTEGVGLGLINRAHKRLFSAHL